MCHRQFWQSSAALPWCQAVLCCTAATHTWAAAILQGCQGELCVTVWGLCAAPQSAMLAVQLGEVTGSQNPGFSWLCCLLPVTKEKGVTKAGEMFHDVWGSIRLLVWVVCFPIAHFLKFTSYLFLVFFFCQYLGKNRMPDEEMALQEWRNVSPLWAVTTAYLARVQLLPFIFEMQWDKHDCCVTGRTELCETIVFILFSEWMLIHS